MNAQPWIGHKRLMRALWQRATPRVLAAALRCGWQGVCVAGVTFLVASPAEAEPESARVLVVAVESGASGLDPEAVRRAIARELRIEVTSEPSPNSLGELTVRIEGEQIQMRFVSAGGGEVHRTVQLPPEPERQLEVVALLAGNLARDEAGELLAQFAQPEQDEGAGSVELEAADDSASEKAEAEPEEPPAPAPPKAPSSRPRPAPPQPSPEEPSGDEEELDWLPINLSLIAPATLYANSERYEFSLEFGVVRSRIGALYGFGMTLFLNEVDGMVRGFTLGGLISRSGGSVYGVQAAGIGNYGAGELHGADIAGIFNVRSNGVYGGQGSMIFNHAEGDVRGVQGTGVFNLATGNVEGGQVAGIFNSSGGSIEGVQVGAVFNVAGGGVEGAQLAGVFNVANGAVEGAQLAGIMNLAGGDVEGVQFGALNHAGDVEGAQIGVINGARNVNGTQIGLVNVADDVNLLPVGLVNIVSTGRNSAVVWGDSNGFANGGLKYTGHGLYTMVAAGYKPSPDEMTASLTFGGQIDLDPIVLSLDVQSGMNTQFKAGYSDDDPYTRLRASVAWQLHPALAVFAGAGPEVEEEVAGEFHIRGYGFGGVQLF